MQLIKRFTDLDKAIELLLTRARVVPNAIDIDIENAMGMVLAEDVVSPIDVPPSDRSAVDGYAIRAEDVSSASPYNPIPLRVIGRIELGTESSDLELPEGTAIEIVTGASLPRGANAVVMYEDTERQGDVIYVTKAVAKFENVSRRGEDIRRGEVIARRGCIVRPWHIYTALSLGITRIKVYRPIKVGVIAVGSELVDPYSSTSLEEVVSTNRVFDSTSRLVVSLLRMYRFVEPRYVTLVNDDINEISSAIDRAAKDNDIVVTVGGTGVGPKDLTPRAVNAIGGEILVRGIAMKPGRPTSIALVDGKPIFLLSGYPVAALVATLFLVLEYIARSIGIQDRLLPKIKLPLCRRLASSPGYTSFVRVKIVEKGDEMCVEPIALHGSGVISTVMQADGIVVVPRDVEGYEAGELVDVYLLNFAG